jgi:hypothetical protein
MRAIQFDSLSSFLEWSFYFFRARMRNISRKKEIENRVSEINKGLGNPEAYHLNILKQKELEKCPHCGTPKKI